MIDIIVMKPDHGVLGVPKIVWRRRAHAFVATLAALAPQHLSGEDKARDSIGVDPKSGYATSAACGSDPTARETWARPSGH